MCKVIAVAMQKGGCAKTSVSLNLGIGLARAGKKVLLIDNDPQGNLTASLGYEEPDDMSDTLASVMMKIINEEPIEPGYGILHHQEGIDLIPGNIELSGLEVLLANVMSRENILKEYIDQIKDQYGYIIIDCIPKSLMFGDEFRDLSLQAKLLYGLLLDRMAMSAKNQWIDNENRVYVVYPISEMQEDLNVSKKKAIEYLKELETVGLVKKKVKGFGLPNHLYVKNFVVSQLA